MLTITSGTTVSLFFVLDFCGDVMWRCGWDVDGLLGEIVDDYAVFEDCEAIIDERCVFRVIRDGSLLVRILSLPHISSPIVHASPLIVIPQNHRRPIFLWLFPPFLLPQRHTRCRRD